MGLRSGTGPRFGTGPLVGTRKACEGVERDRRFDGTICGGGMSPDPAGLRGGAIIEGFGGGAIEGGAMSEGFWVAGVVTG